MRRKPKKDKQYYSPSRLALYLRCPRMFDLSRHFKPLIENEAALRDGNLFEGYVFGFKDTAGKTEKELVGRKKQETINVIRGHASHVRPLFFEEPDIIGAAATLEEAQQMIIGTPAGPALEIIEDFTAEGDDARFYVQTKPNSLGKAFHWLRYETPDYVVHGEADYYGPLNLDVLPDVVYDMATLDDLYRAMDVAGTDRVIADLKYTESISGVWDFKYAKEEYLQSVFYPWMHWESTGEILPFVYVVVEKRFQRPIVRLVVMQLVEEDFTKFVKPLVETVHLDMIYAPKADKVTCEGGFSSGYGRCWYMDYCQHGRAVVGGVRRFDFAELRSNLFFKNQPEINSDEQE